MIENIEINKDILKNSFAIVKIEGKQYKVIKNDIVKLEKIEGVNAGDKLGNFLKYYYYS